MLTIPQQHFTPFLPTGVSYIKGQLECGQDGAGVNSGGGLEAGSSSPLSTTSTTGEANGEQGVPCEGGYLHWQLLVVLRKKGTRKTIRGIFGPYHCELTRSEAADAYVWKEETRVSGTQFELGVRKLRRNNRTDWEYVWEQSATGSIMDIEAGVRFQHYRTIRTIRSDFAQAIGNEREVEVYWGPTGTGKSRRAWEEAGVDAYPKDPRTKWWDGYNGETNVVIDEFRGVIDIANLLRWFDRYPVRVEVKGGSTVLRAKKIWLTSNLQPQDWYPGLDDQTYEALRRRIKVTHFDMLSTNL